LSSSPIQQRYRLLLPRSSQPAARAPDRRSRRAGLGRRAL